MTVLPIVERELRVASRKRVTQGLRFWSAAGVMVVGVMALLMTSSTVSQRQLGRDLFTVSSWLALIWCWLSGLMLTADVISSERRQDTLGLLFLTKLRGYDVFLGKMASSSLQSIYGLLAIVPVLMVTVLMGGVTGAEVLRVGLVLLVALILSLSLGASVSALCVDTRKGIFVALGLMVLILLWGPGLELGLQVVGSRRGGGPGWWMMLSPSVSLFLAFDNVYRMQGEVRTYWAGLGVTAAMAGVCLLVGIWGVTRVWGYAVGPARSLGVARVIRWLGGWGRVKEARRRQRGSSNDPIGWLCGRDRTGAWLAWWVVIVVGLVWAFFLVLPVVLSKRADPAGLYLLAMCSACLMHILIKIIVGIEASRRFAEDSQSGALELLLVTPVRSGRILRAAFWGLARQFFPHLLVLAVVNLIMLVFIGVDRPSNLPNSAIRFFSLVMIGGTGLLAVDFYALCWVGMHEGLRTRRHHRAILRVVVRLMVIPWAVAGVVLLMGGASGAVTNSTLEGLGVVWVLAGAAYPWTLGSMARSRLQRGFRRLASEWPEVRRWPWRRLVQVR